MFRINFLFLGLFLPAIGFAAITKDGNYYELKNCGHKAYTDYTITVKQNSSIRKTGSVGPDGCVFYRFKTSEIKPAQNLIIELKNGKVLSETVPSDSTYVPEPSPVNPNPVNPKPTPSPTPYPPMPSPQLPSADLSKVRATAENQARMIANRIVDKYGRAENARYNMAQGVHEGVRYYLTISNLYGDQYYKSAFAYGTQKAQTSGLEVGQAEAQRQAGATAKQDVFNKFRAVVDTSMQPDLNLSVPLVNYPGAVAQIDAPRSINDRIRDRDNEFYNYLREFEYLERKSFYEIYGWGSGYQFELIRSWYRQDWAWQAWLNRRLGGSYENEMEYYQKISDPSKTANYSEAQNAFISRFKQVYNNVIDDKWDRAVQAPNPTYRGFGFQIGQGIGKEYSHDVGYFDGYRQSYTQASRDGFSQSFRTQYEREFYEAVRVHQTIPQVAEVTVKLADKVNGVHYFLPLQHFDLLIEKAVNVGAQGSVSVSVNGAQVSGVPAQEAQLPALSTTKEVIKLENVGLLNPDVSPYKPTPVNVVVGGKTQILYVQVYFDSVMKTLGATGQRRFVDYGVLWLKHEFENYGKGSFYKSDSSLLKRLVAVHLALVPQHKVNISAYREDFRAVLGKEPGFFSGAAKKEAWRDAQSLINQLQ